MALQRCQRDCGEYRCRRLSMRHRVLEWVDVHLRRYFCDGDQRTVPAMATLGESCCAAVRKMSSFYDKAFAEAGLGSRNIPSWLQSSAEWTSRRP
jgi:hypothetical protein